MIWKCNLVKTNTEKSIWNITNEKFGKLHEKPMGNITNKKQDKISGLEDRVDELKHSDNDKNE